MMLRLALFCCVAALAGCARSRPAERPPERPVSGVSKPDEARAGVPASRPPGAVTPSAPGAPVEIELDEYVIRMPTVLPPGRTTFKVRNVGSHRHTILIRADAPGGLNATLRPNLEGGQTVDWTVDLAPGTYRVWCPIGPHSTLGMHTALTVSPGP